MEYEILSINPGSTSTRVALYRNKSLIFSKNVVHTDEELFGFHQYIDELEFRTNVVQGIIKENAVDLSKLNAVVGRGGLIPNIHAGGYLVDESLKQLILSGNLSPHASNLGALLADKIAAPLKIPAYIYDAVTSNEFTEIAMITGIPDIRRQSMCHVLNMKAMGRKVAEKYGTRYEDLNLIIAHLGGGISIGAHKHGKIVDAIGDDSGPFSPERAGSLPLLYVIDMCYSGNYTKQQMQKKIRGLGGIKAHLGTHDCRLVEKMIADGNKQAKLIYESEAYQIAKGIGQMAPVLRGKVDYIVLTGGMAYSQMMTNMIKEQIDFIAPIEIFPGENEMEALTFGCLRILKGEEQASIWNKEQSY